MGYNELLRDLQRGASAQAAGISRGHGGPPPRTVSARSGLHRMRCASLLKPLYAWVTAARIPDTERWQRHAEPAVVISSNSDTRSLWLAVGPLVILDDIYQRTGVSWPMHNADPSRFGSIEVAADEVATAYAALAQAAFAGDPVAGSVLEWMRRVEGDQTYGTRQALGAPEAGIKCGWFGEPDETCLRTHAVAVLPDAGTRATVVVALTAQPYTDARKREVYHTRVAQGHSVEAEHEKASGPLLRDLMAMTLSELGHGDER
ncbi:hypothetical protein ACIBQX_46530 [Nonomuraea sp. NPDC049714]|uniref:hypothetical protein n=1 Tax=Nonomuraea sp. NPDC049714 TaxID=3364357 RepID=UPI0037B69758